MQKDLKTGMLLGSVLVAVAALWLSTRPSLSVKSRMPSPGFAARSKTTAPLKSNVPAAQQTAATPTPPPTIESSRQAEQLQSTEHRDRQEPKQAKTPTLHIVRDGETLSDIAYRYYGSTNKWQKIFDANREIINDANKLKPGTKLTIPN